MYSDEVDSLLNQSIAELAACSSSYVMVASPFGIPVALSRYIHTFGRPVFLSFYFSTKYSQMNMSEIELSDFVEITYVFICMLILYTING